ncbi:MAG TPA: hypothetical protein PKA91_14770, partial [Leptospiraceae bacterium]|nr:hypothetical protein [Leptospiraceae bacterium]
QYKLLTQDGETKEHLTEGETGLLYFARPGARASGMFRLIPGSEAERIRLSYTSEGMTERNGQILASEDHFFYPGLGIRQELHDARSVLFSRLLPGVSVVDPLFSPDGNTLYYIEKDRFERRLIRASWKNEEIKDPETIFHVPFSGILRFPAVSPDGQQLAFVARKDETGMGVVLVCDARASNCKTVAAGPAAKVRPRFSKDGKQLFFSSDADGIYNIYSVNLASGEILKRTRTLTGFFDPVPTESALYALSYNGKGFDVAEISYEHMLAEKSGLFAAHGDESSFFEAETEAPLPGQPQNWPEDPDYNGALSMRPYFAGLLGSGSLLGLGVAALDPLERHVLAAGIVAGAPDPYAWAFYDYSRFVVGFSGFYSTNYWKRDRAPGCLNPSDPNRFICDDQYSFVESMGGYLRYTFEGRYVSFQVLPGYASTKMRNARRIRTLEMDARDLNLSGPSFAMLLGRTEEFAESVSPERGFRFFALTDYYSKTTSRRELDPQTQRPIDYGAAEGGLALYLPSFFDHHVNYLSGYAFTSYGPDREVEKVRLSRLQRGIAYDRSPTATSAVVWTYEYRLPIAWLSASPESMPHFILRNIGMSLFYEAGAAFEKIPYQRDYKSSVGVTFQFGITALYLPLAPFRLTFVKGLGREGENQVYLGYETTFGPGMDSGRNIPGNRIVEPWHRPIPRSTEEPGYFRRASAGGILE